MAPSLSTSISSPSFFKDREDDEGEEEIQDLHNLVNNNNIDINQFNFDQHAQEENNNGNNNNNNNNSNSIQNTLNELTTNTTHHQSIQNTQSESLLDLIALVNGTSFNNNNDNEDSASSGAAAGAASLPLSDEISGVLENLDNLNNTDNGNNNGNNDDNSSVHSGNNNNYNSSNKQYDIKTQKISLKGSAGSSPRNQSLRIYRTFPYRGSLPLPLLQIFNEAAEQVVDEEQKESKRPKPSSTNGIRHSRQYKGLQQLGYFLNQLESSSGAAAAADSTNPELILPNNIDNDDNDKQSNNIIEPESIISTPSSPKPFDSSSYQSPPPPISSSQEDIDIIVNNSSNSNSNNNNDNNSKLSNSNTSSSQWTELMQSLGGSNSGGASNDASLQTIQQEQPDQLQINNTPDFNDIVLDGISIDSLPQELNELDSLKCNSNNIDHENLINNNNNDSNIDNKNNNTNIVNDNDKINTTQLFKDEIMKSLEPMGNRNPSPIFTESRANGVRIKENLDLMEQKHGGLEVSNNNNNNNKKQQLSRTITFADPSSIYSFFGAPPPQQQQQQDSQDLSISTPVDSFKNEEKQPSNTNKGNDRSRSSSKMSLSTLFPKLPFSSQSPTLSPSKFYYPLLQPEPTTLIRGFSSKADINKRGLKRAKKTMDMEDEWLCQSPFGPEESQMALFGIFDGHSGKNAAVTTKEILPGILLKYIQTAQQEYGKQQITDMRGVFLSAFKEVDALLSKYEYEGTTATVVLIWRAGNQRYVQSANVGDSTAFLSYAGETLFLSKDHRVTDPEEQQRIKSDGVVLTENQTRINGLMVSRALGDHFIKNLNCGLTGEPYVSPPICLTPFHSHLIVASDGLWDVISGNRAMEIVKLEQTEEKMASALLNCAVNSIKSKDNISIIVVTL
ncbi:hypothetical protein CYY_003970 [Polysphondylium violaceum]|uniref:PPM-type phosphatase domain-containing protein n=1 Tax=Polysphondylium violaceum TaxID=133409 RepID=A0A8J4PVD4_9MYCE|nr:hypothetical protein CYY_003970 [Polysphondylium violaceum]